MPASHTADHRSLQVDLMLILTAFAAIISCLGRAMGPRPSGWAELPEFDVHSFTASFGVESD